MGNSLKIIPWLLDSTGLVTKEKIYIKVIHFYPSANSDDFIIKDASNTNTIIALKASTDYDAETLPIEYWIERYVPGMHVNTVDGTSYCLVWGK